jgi:hypothetical protein
MNLRFSSIAGADSHLRGASTTTPTYFNVRFVITTTRSFS